MKTSYSLLVLSLMAILIVPSALAVSIGSSVSPGITTEDFEPEVWMCDNRMVVDDNTDFGRFSGPGALLSERKANYAFEGEQISWEVLVYDRNGIEKIQDVFGTIGSSQGPGNDIEVNCDLNRLATTVDSSCNAQILGQDLTGTDQSQLAAYYDCTFTVETADSMAGESWITVEALDMDGLSGTMADNEFWFFNPIIGLGIENDLIFDDVRPGAVSYSETLLVRNDAEDGSGVMLDMFISGTDFFDLSSSGAACPTSNVLNLGNGDSFCDSTDAFCYRATSGAYSSQGDNRRDAEGYVGINYGTGFNHPTPFYGASNGDATGFEIIQDDTSGTGFGSGPYFAGNTLNPGAEMSLTFRLNLPSPCNGDFDSGDIFFWGEAI